jgi:hypothetical protein
LPVVGTGGVIDEPTLIMTAYWWSFESEIDQKTRLGKTLTRKVDLLNLIFSGAVRGNYVDVLPRDGDNARVFIELESYYVLQPESEVEANV